MTISIPTKTIIPFAASGDKNEILIPAQTGGTASYTAGFPPLTMTPKASGGIPPSGKDMNGILFNLSQAIQYQQAGGHFAFDGTFASSVGGYPIGAIVQSTDNSGFWVNGTANNSTNPETFGAGWLPLKQVGATLLTVASSNITLTALEAGKDVIVISGALTSNVNIIFPTWKKSWSIVNNSTGDFAITAKTSSGTGNILLPNGNQIIGDGTNIISLTASLVTKEYVDTTADTVSKDNAIGWNQTWLNVTSSRKTNQNYTNSTGKPIFIEISDKNVVNSGLELVLVDPSGNPQLDITLGYFCFSSGSTNACISSIIPNEAVYKAYKLSSDGTRQTTQQQMQWSELR